MSRKNLKGASTSRKWLCLFLTSSLLLTAMLARHVSILALHHCTSPVLHLQPFQNSKHFYRMLALKAVAIPYLMSPRMDPDQSLMTASEVSHIPNNWSSSVSFTTG